MRNSLYGKGGALISALVLGVLLGSSQASASVADARTAEIVDTPAPSCITVTKTEIFSTVAYVNNQCRDRLTVRVDIVLEPDTSCQTFEPFANGQFDEAVLFAATTNESGGIRGLVLC